MFTRSIAMALLMLLGAMPGRLQAQDPEAADAASSTASSRTATVKPPIDIRAEESDYDLRTGLTRFETNVTITRGAMEVQADRGRVRQAGGQITEVELEGSPSTWRDRLEDGSVVTGEARMIHFDVVDNVVTLTGNAIIRHEQGEFTGDELVYDLTAESLAGRSTSGERVRVVIQPDAMSAPRPAPDRTSSSNAEDRPTEAGAGPAGSATDSSSEPTSDPEAGEAATTGAAGDDEAAAGDPSVEESGAAEPEAEEPEAEEPTADDPPGDGRTMPDFS